MTPLTAASPTHTETTMTTEAWDTDRIYTYEDKGSWFYFFSPDGRGRIYFANEHEAKEQTGLKSVVHLLGVPID